MHLAEGGEFISKHAPAQIKAALAKKPNARVYNYPGQRHAFSRHGGAHYNAEAAALAPERTYAFLHRQLRLPADALDAATVPGLIKRSTRHAIGEGYMAALAAVRCAQQAGESMRFQQIVG